MPLEGPSEGLEQLKMFTGWNKYWGLLIPTLHTGLPPLRSQARSWWRL